MAQPEPPSPALTTPCGPLTIHHLIYRRYTTVCHLGSRLHLGNFKKQRKYGFFILILFLWRWNQTQAHTYTSQALYSQPLIFETGSHDPLAQAILEFTVQSRLPGNM